MGKETTPQKIDDKIIEFCNSIAPNSTLEYIEVHSEANCTLSDCFPNVQKKVEANGGKMQLGWAIWIRPNILLNAECHAIWVSDTGEKIDITPKEESRILFLSDDTISFTGHRIGSKYKTLTDSTLVAEFVALLEKQSCIISKTATSQKYITYPQGLSERLNEINIILKQKAGRNEPCPCQSGLKYKRCCEA